MKKTSLQNNELTLFDIIERNEDPKLCEHRRMRPTITKWPNDPDPRMTMTCLSCGYIRGRWPSENSLKEIL